MRHDLILRLLRLPLVVAVGVCGVVAAFTPFAQMSDRPARSVPPTASSSDGQPVGDALVGERAAASNANRAGTQRANSTPVSHGRGPGDRADREASAGDAGFPLGVGGQGMDTEALLVSMGDAVASTTSRLSDTISSVRRHFARRLSESLAQQTSDAAPQKQPADTHDSPGAPDKPAAVDNEPASSPTTQPAATGIQLRNAQANRYPVSFLLNNRVVRLQPGDEASSDASSAIVRLDRGGDRGIAQYSLTPGHYEFRLTQDGWQLKPAAR